MRKPPSPAPSLLAAFAVLITIGTVLLMLPFATRSGVPTAFIDALFTATSAACVTGLVVLDTGTHWSPFGQVVIMLLIQAGGFGIMAGSTLFLSLVVG
ncbi:MAG: Trk family potassium uptake protein, partial [Candidatus Limnocylindria bacterium]